jgi:hypothetical protein
MMEILGTAKRSHKATERKAIDDTATPDGSFSAAPTSD